MCNSTYFTFRVGLVDTAVKTVRVILNLLSTPHSIFSSICRLLLRARKIYAQASNLYRSRGCVYARWAASCGSIQSVHFFHGPITLFFWQGRFVHRPVNTAVRVVVVRVRYGAEGRGGVWPAGILIGCTVRCGSVACGLYFLEFAPAVRNPLLLPWCHFNFALTNVRRCICWNKLVCFKTCVSQTPWINRVHAAAVQWQYFVLLDASVTLYV